MVPMAPPQPPTSVTPNIIDTKTNNNKRLMQTQTPIQEKINDSNSPENLDSVMSSSPTQEQNTISVGGRNGKKPRKNAYVSNSLLRNL